MHRKDVVGRFHDEAGTHAGRGVVQVQDEVKGLARGLGPQQLVQLLDPCHLIWVIRVYPGSEEGAGELAVEVTVHVAVADGCCCWVGQHGHCGEPGSLQLPRGLQPVLHQVDTRHLIAVGAPDHCHMAQGSRGSAASTSRVGGGPGEDTGLLAKDRATNKDQGLIENSDRTENGQTMKHDAKIRYLSDDVDDISLSSLSSSDKNDLSEDFSDDFIDIEDSNRTRITPEEISLKEEKHEHIPTKDISDSPKENEKCFSKTDEWIDISVSDRSECTKHTSGSNLISPDTDYRAGSSFELSPSDSSDGTYMWDEEGLEPIGNVHPVGSYESSEMNSIDILNNLESCDLEDDDLMLDVDLPEDASVENGKTNDDQLPKYQKIMLPNLLVFTLHVQQSGCSACAMHNRSPSFEEDFLDGVLTNQPFAIMASTHPESVSLFPAPGNPPSPNPRWLTLRLHSVLVQEPQVLQPSSSLARPTDHAQGKLTKWQHSEDHSELAGQGAHPGAACQDDSFAHDLQQEGSGSLEGRPFSSSPQLTEEVAKSAPSAAGWDMTVDAPEPYHLANNPMNDMQVVPTSSQTLTQSSSGDQAKRVGRNQSLPEDDTSQPKSLQLLKPSILSSLVPPSVSESSPSRTPTCKNLPVMAPCNSAKIQLTSSQTNLANNLNPRASKLRPPSGSFKQKQIINPRPEPQNFQAKTSIPRPLTKRKEIMQNPNGNLNSGDGLSSNRYSRLPKPKIH
ncbi:Protein FAM190B [Myotis davidii]|uniref:Protein FAM190B n=1 Tax=Myotis davidii TaxID=225400 RepID=L5LM63_MYODS|nr:Protein FAM190B [Myotis davidii]